MLNNLVSIIIPVYNVELYLKECLDSVLSQTYTNLEIIIVNDGSTDNSSLICEEYKYKDNRIKVINQKNAGLSNARNTGLSNATGKYVYFLDSDDYINRITIEKLVYNIENENSDFLFFDGDVFYTDFEYDSNVSLYERIKKYNSTNGSNMLYVLLKDNEYRTAVPLMFFKRDYLINNNLFFYEGIVHEDELFTYFVYITDGIVSHCNEKLYYRRMRPNSIMTNNDNNLNKTLSLIKVYNEIEKKSKEYNKYVTNVYLIRIAKNIIGKYNKLSNNDKLLCKNEISKFKKNVIKHNGFKDNKLKIKCATFPLNYIFKFYNHFYKLLFKEKL